jgi:uncharacterized membrane protein YdjX (TVP38/TMEM64 family)
MYFWTNLPDKKKHWIIAGANILALLIATALIFWNYFSEGLIFHLTNSNFEVVISYFEAKSFAMQLAIVLFLVLVEVIIGLIPAVVMYPIIGALIGSYWGIGLIFLGNIIGNSINYYQGKVIARAFVDNKKNLKIIHRLEDGGAWSLFFLRLNPLTSFDAISYFAGALGMKFKNFFMATIIGITPLVVLGTIAGEEVLNKYDFGYEILVIFTIGYITYSIIKSKPIKKFKKL